MLLLTTIWGILSQMFTISLQEVLVKSMAKGGVKWGVRMAAVSGFYTTICTLSTVYRNKVSGNLIHLQTELIGSLKSGNIWFFLQLIHRPKRTKNQLY